MNKLLLKLAEQANMTDDKFGMFFAKDNHNEDGVDLEKFAELIVRECIDRLVKESDAWEQFSRNPPEGQENNAGPALFAAYRLKEDAVSRLEEHFGVEE